MLKIMVTLGLLISGGFLNSCGSTQEANLQSSPSSLTMADLTGVEGGKNYKFTMRRNSLVGNWGRDDYSVFALGNAVKGTVQGSSVFYSVSSSLAVGNLPCGTVNIVMNNKSLIGKVCGRTIRESGLKNSYEVSYRAGMAVARSLRTHFPSAVWLEAEKVFTYPF